MELKSEYLNYYNLVNRRLEESGALMVELKKTNEEIFIPTRKYPSDAGYDCRARIDEPIIIKAGKRALIPLGFSINIPLNYTGDLRPRSGLTSNHGIVVGYGTIDAGYTGEVKATIFNFGDDDFTINRGDRIAQLVLLPIASSKDNLKLSHIVVKEKLIELVRSNNGHGSSGIK